MQFDLKDIVPPRILKGDYLWPNELSTYQDRRGNTVMLIPDGFLMPGQSDGGIYAVVNPTSIYTKPVRITAPKDGWFYHRAMYVELPGGNQGILTARATKPLFGEGKGELVWLSLPNSATLETEYLPNLQEVVLANGPDVMFEVFDMDKNDLTIEIVAAHFFQKELSIYSLQAVCEYPYVKIVHTSKMRTNGRPYGLCLTSFQPPEVANRASVTPASSNGSSFISNFNHQNPRHLKRGSLERKEARATHILITTHECSYDIPSAVQMIYSTMQGTYPRVKTSDISIRDRLDYWKIVSNQRNNAGTEDVEKSATIAQGAGGGALYAYEIPRPSSSSSSSPSSSHWSTNEDHQLHNWKRIELFKGFKVRGWGGIFSPGAPGFPYVFHLPKKKISSPPLILIAGDCTGSAYVFTPRDSTSPSSSSESPDVPRYDLAFEIECGATVGSAAIGLTKDKSGDLNLYIPAYELNKVHVFRLSDLSKAQKSVNVQEMVSSR